MGFRINFVAERSAMDSRMVVGEQRAMDSPTVGPFATPPFRITAPLPQVLFQKKILPNFASSTTYSTHRAPL